MEGGGVRVDVFEELKFLGRVGGPVGGSVWVGLSDWGGGVNVDEELKVFVKIQKEKNRGVGFGGGGGGSGLM